MTTYNSKVARSKQIKKACYKSTHYVVHVSKFESYLHSTMILQKRERERKNFVVLLKSNGFDTFFVFSTSKPNMVAATLPIALPRLEFFAELLLQITTFSHQFCSQFHFLFPHTLPCCQFYPLQFVVSAAPQIFYFRNNKSILTAVQRSILQKSDRLLQTVIDLPISELGKQYDF